MDSVQSGLAPFFGACARCEIESNYKGGSCVCTPFCGSCAPERFNADEPGVACVTLNDIHDDYPQVVVKLIPGSGAVRQEGPDAFSAQCGFGAPPSRIHKRGGRYDASIADLPTFSLQVVDMKTGTFQCSVALDSEPTSIIYVPPPPDEGILMDIVAIVFLVGVLICAFVGVLSRQGQSIAY